MLQLVKLTHVISLSTSPARTVVQSKTHWFNLWISTVFNTITVYIRVKTSKANLLWPLFPRHSVQAERSFFKSQTRKEWVENHTCFRPVSQKWSQHHLLWRSSTTAVVSDKKSWLAVKVKETEMIGVIGSSDDDCSVLSLLNEVWPHMHFFPLNHLFLFSGLIYLGAKKQSELLLESVTISRRE